MTEEKLCDIGSALLTSNRTTNFNVDMERRTHLSTIRMLSYQGLSVSRIAAKVKRSRHAVSNVLHGAQAKRSRSDKLTLQKTSKHDLSLIYE